MSFLSVVVAPIPFVLISYSLDTLVMLSLIVIDIQYSQKADFSFEKGSNRQNHSSSGSPHLLKYSPSKISNPPHWGGGFTPPTPYCCLENPGSKEKHKT